MQVLAVTIVILAAAAAAASRAETLDQHREWSRKFADQSEPLTTGSIDLRPDVEVRTEPSGCPRGATQFGNLPFERWRVVDCEGQSLESEILL